MSIADDLMIAAMRVLPKNGLSRAMGALARLRLPRPLLGAVLRAYVRHFGVDLADADRPLESYETMDDFFTRGLRPGARPLPDDPEAVLSPCDGEVISAGEFGGKHLVQAKGKRYSLARFLEDSVLAQSFEGGAQVTIYLHPRNYHRVHAPLGGKITGYRYVPGHLFPVNRAAVRRVDALFAINERLVTVLDTAAGRVALAMVGAYGVGHITLAYDTLRTNEGGTEIVRRDYEQALAVRPGDEVGTFHFGSTVIVLFPPGRVELAPLKPGEAVRMGQPIGRRLAKGGRLRILQGM
jgi:phosphatidylserine decarboxylase